MLKASLLTLLLFVNSNLFAYENQMFLKGGFSYVAASIEAQQGSEDDMKGTGFNTHFGYKWKFIEFLLSSYTYWGQVEGLVFNARGERINGHGDFRHVSFGPVFKYHFANRPVYKRWTIFAGLGPVWSLQTVKLKHFTSSGPQFNNHEKLTFESFGGLLALGIEEQLEYKEAHPVFIEFIYSYKKSHKLTIVNNDSNETKILAKEKSGQELSGHFFMISVGLTIF